MDGFREIRPELDASPLRPGGKGRARLRRNHGSRARISGELFRALASIYLNERKDVPRDTLAGIVSNRLAERGIEYHPRTVRRQILGSVASVPPEVEGMLMELCLTDVFGGDESALTVALAAHGYQVTEADARAPYVSVDRLGELVRLWLYFHRGRSKRALAERLHTDLGKRDVALTRESIQWKLAGNGYLVRREVLSQILEYLAPFGVRDEQEARNYLVEHADDIELSLDGRSLIDAKDFRRYCRLWQIQNREASSRRLAQLLQHRLEDRGIKLGIEHLQRSIAGKAPRVRRDLFEAMEQLLQESVGPDQDLSSIVNRAEWNGPRQLDLAWVRCEPIAELAREWMEQNPGSTMRQLALRVVKTIRRMGYQSSHNTIQPILGGWKKRTRGYVYRALLKQFPDRQDDRIPEEHFVGPILGAEFSSERKRSKGEMSALSEHPSEVGMDIVAKSGGGRPGSSWPGPEIDERDLAHFIEEAKTHLSQAKSPHFARLAALRAEKLFGISAEDAYATILEHVIS